MKNNFNQTNSPRLASDVRDIVKSSLQDQVSSALHLVLDTCVCVRT